MPKEYLLDTNAYYNLLKESREQQKGSSVFSTEIKTLVNSNLFISAITKIEIISVLGKYARGNSGGFQRCMRCVSKTGEPCQNQWYTAPRARWTRREISGWQKLIQETLLGTSSLIKVNVLPFDDKTIQVAEQLIAHALVHNFASMDAMIAATAQEAIKTGRDLTVVTSDKGLKACLSKANIACWDAFQVGAMVSSKAKTESLDQKKHLDGSSPIQVLRN